MERLIFKLFTTTLALAVAALAVFGAVALTKKATLDRTKNKPLIIIDPGHGGLTNTII